MKITPTIIKPIMAFLIILLSLSPHSTTSAQTTILDQNFDSSAEGWSTASGWSNDAVSFTGNTTGHWHITPFNNYGSDTDSYVSSGTLDLSNFETMTLSLNLRYNTEGSWDGMNLEYNIAGAGWNTLGAVGDGTNWYNDNDVDAIADNAHGWSGDNGGWATSSISLPAAFDNQSDVQFRFFFSSDGSSNDDGVAFDDFKIEGTQLCNAPIATFATDASNCGSGDFDIIVSLTDMGDADAIIITDSESNTFDNSGAGYTLSDFPVTIGSYSAGTNVDVTLDDNDVSCPLVSPSQNEDCACMILPTATVSALAPDCGTATFDIEVTIDSDGDGDANMSDILIDGIVVQADATIGTLYTFNQAIGSYTITIAAQGSSFVTCISSDYTTLGSCNNDECAEAFSVLTDGTATTSLDVATYTSSGNNLSCDGGSSNEDAYYKFVAPASGSAIISVDNTNLSGSNTQYVEGAIYASCADATSNTEIFCAPWSDDFTGGRLVSGLTAGNTYYLEIEHYSNDWTGTYDVSITDPAPSIAALTSTCFDLSTAIHLYDLGNSGDDYDCGFATAFSGSADDQLSYIYSPTSNETIDIIIDNVVTTSGDFAVGIFDNTTGTPVTCVGGSLIGADATISNLALTGGTDYIIIIGGQASTQNSAACLTIQPQCGTTYTNTLANDCAATTFSRTINFSNLGSAAHIVLDDADGNTYGTSTSGISTSTDYVFAYTNLSTRVLTISGYDASNNLICSEELELKAGCTPDICTDAIDITNGCISGDLADANIDGGDLIQNFISCGNGNSIAQCGANASFTGSSYTRTDHTDLWFSATPNGSNEVTVNISNLANGNVMVLPYLTNGTCPTAASANDLLEDHIGNLSQTLTGGTCPYFTSDGSITFSGTALTTATTVYFRVMAYAENGSGATNCETLTYASFDICTSIPQANDICNDGLPIIDATTFLPQTQSGDISAANVDAETSPNNNGTACGASIIATSEEDLWYTLTTPATGSYYLDLDIDFTGTEDEIYVILEEYCSSGTVIGCESISADGTISFDQNNITNFDNALGNSNTYNVKIVLPTGSTATSFDISGQLIAENNTCEVMQNVFPGFDVDVNNYPNFNFATASGAVPAVTGSDLWYQFDPETGQDANGVTLGSTTAAIIIGGMAADEELTLVLYKGNIVSANNCNDLAGDYLETLVISGDGTFELSCLDELHTSVSGGYILRVVQTGGANVSDNVSIRVEPQPFGPHNNDCENIWDGSGPTNLGIGDASTNFNPYFLLPGFSNYLSGDFENATDCHPDITSAMCNGVNQEAIASNEDRDLWYVFEVPSTPATCDLTTSTIVDEMKFLYNAGSAFEDAVLYVYSNCDDASLLGCSGALDGAPSGAGDDQFNDPQSTWSIGDLTQGESYLLRIKPHDISSTGVNNEFDFDISMQEGNPKPCNDEIEDAVELTVNTNCTSSPWYPTLDTYSAQGARDEETFGQDDVFFKFTAPLPANGGDYNPQVSPTYPGPERSWVNIFLENVSGHIIQMELWNTQTLVATATQYSTSSTAGDKIWARFGNLEPGEEYEIRLYHGETVTTNVQYKIRVEAGDNDNTVTDCDAGDFATTPILCGSCGGENSTPYIADPAVSSLSSNSSNNHCEIWYKIDLPTMAGGSGTYWIAEVEGYEQVLDFELRQQIATESTNHGTQEDFDHPCSSRPLSSSMGTLIDSYPVTYELLNNAPTYSSIMLNGMGSNATECTVSCSTEEATSHGGGFRKVYRDILGPAAGTKNYLYLRVFMDENDPSYIACHDGGVMINPANVLFRGPYSSDPTTSLATVIPGTPDLPCTGIDSDNDGIVDSVDLDDDNDGISDVQEGGDTADFDGDGIPNRLDLDSDNDGLADIVEANPTDADMNGVADIDEDGDGRVPVDGNDDLTNDADNNGWDNTYDNIGSTGTPLSPLNTDSNGNPDYLDIDADDDGIVDIIEWQPTTGYIAPSGVYGSDGWDDALDGIAMLNDIDGNGTPDYRDTDTDGDMISDTNEGYDTDNDGIADGLSGDLGDDDNDGLLNQFDNLTLAIATTATNPDNDGQIATNPFPNDDMNGASATEPDWRDLVDSDNDGIADNIDLDDDNDGISDVQEGGDTADFDGDGIPNRLDLDSDNDGLADIVEANPTDADMNGVADIDEDGDGRVPVDANDDLVNDSDNNGWDNTYDNIGSTGTPLSPLNTDSNGNPDYLDIDADDDGIVDIIEWQPTTGYIAPSGVYGSDGWDDALDGIAMLNDIDGNGTPDYRDTDTDGDMISDTNEGYDTDNDGIADGLSGDLGDDDNDGLLNQFDNLTLAIATTATNPDNDGQIATNPFPNDDVNGASATEPDWRDLVDSDNDGIADNIDLDDDNDGISDVQEGGDTADFDGDGIPNRLDLDSDNDGLADIVEANPTDADMNGVADIDEDGDGRVPVDGNDDLVNDSDNNGWDNTYDNIGSTGTPLSPLNTDSNGNPDYLDIDADDDGIVDIIEWQPTTGYIAPSGVYGTDGWDDALDGIAMLNDIDGNGTPDYRDTDTDGDMISDTNEGYDTDNDGIADGLSGDLGDDDNDGLLNQFDNLTLAIATTATNPDNDGQIATNPFPNDDVNGASATEPDWRDLVNNACGTVSLKVFLEGPYDVVSGTMTTLLNDNHLLPGQDKNLSSNFSVLIAATHTPFGQPYSAAPWNHTATSGASFGDPMHPDAAGTETAYPSTVTDWVLITVREDGILAANDVWSCAGFLHEDGTVTFPETCQCLTIDPAKDYYILVQHRNHMGVLSPSPVNITNSGGTLDWDFTTTNSYLPNIFRVGQKEIAPGVWGMYGGNADQITNINAINSADKTIWKEDQNSLNYKLGDFNLNVITNSEDKTIWKNNQNKTSGVNY